MLTVGDAGAKGLGAFAAFPIEPGTEILRVGSAGATSSAPSPPRQNKGVSSGTAYVLDAPVPLGELDEDDAALVKRFPFLGDPRLWPAASAPRRVAVKTGVAESELDLERLHGTTTAPLFVPQSGTSHRSFHEHGFLNHSCCPDVVRYFSDGALVLRSARSIDTDEEVHDTYFYPLVPAHLRAEACSRYGFKCNCPRCSAENSLAAPLQVWTKLTWANVVRILGQMVRVRAQAKGDPAALRSSEDAQNGVAQLHGLIQHTEHRLRDADLSDRDLTLCLASWASAAAAMGDLLASARGDFQNASSALGRAASWAQVVSPGHALSFGARSFAYALASAETDNTAVGCCQMAGNEAVTGEKLLAMHNASLGSDFAIDATLGGLTEHLRVGN